MSAVISAVRGATAAMGTRFEIVIATENEDGARPFLEAALREIEDWHVQLTRFSSDSLLSHINRTAARRPVRLDAATFELLAASCAVNEQSHGAFDIALGSGRVLLDAGSRSISFDRPGVTLDLGGIAKGFALDRALNILRSGGIDSALLHGGTSTVLAVGAPPARAAWRIALAHCHPSRHVDLCDQALSVSRPFAQFVDGGTHIQDPRSGDGIRHRRIAVAIGPSACLADAWSTAISVLGYRPETLSNDWTTLIEPEHE